MNRQIVIPGSHQYDLQVNLLQWMKERIGEVGDFDPVECRVIAHVLTPDDGVLTPDHVLCVVALNRWTTHTVEGNIASDGTKRWFSRTFAYTVYDYCFRFAGKSRMNFTVRPENTAAVNMHEKLGHKFEFRLADAFGDDQDALIYGLTRRQWLAGPYSKPSRI